MAQVSDHASHSSNLAPQVVDSCADFRKLPPHRGKLKGRPLHVVPEDLRQAFSIGRNVYGLLFHLEVTASMVSEWVRTFTQEHDGVKD